MGWPPAPDRVTARWSEEQAHGSIKAERYGLRTVSVVQRGGQRASKPLFGGRGASIGAPRPAELDEWR